MRADDDLVEVQHLLDRDSVDHGTVAVAAADQGQSLAGAGRQRDDRRAEGLPVHLGQLKIGPMPGEEPTIANRRQLRDVAEHQDRLAERQQIAPHLFADHGDLVDDDEARISHDAVAVEDAADKAFTRIAATSAAWRRLARLRGSAGDFELRAIDERVDGRSVGAAFPPHDLRRFPGVGAEHDAIAFTAGNFSGQRRSCRSRHSRQDKRTGGCGRVAMHCTAASACACCGDQTSLAVGRPLRSA